MSNRYPQAAPWSKVTPHQRKLSGKRRAILRALGVKRFWLLSYLQRLQVESLAKTMLLLGEWEPEATRRSATSYSELTRLYRQQLQELGLTEAAL